MSYHTYVVLGQVFAVILIILGGFGMTSAFIYLMVPKRRTFFPAVLTLLGSGMGLVIGVVQLVSK